MITYFYRNAKNKKLQKLSEFHVGSWINVTDPDEEELKFLSENLGLEAGHLHDAMDLHEVPRLEIENKVIYIFTRYPYDDEFISTAPLLIIIADKFIATITPRKALFLEQLHTYKKDLYTTQKVKLLLFIVSRINLLYNNFLNQISRQIRTFKVKLQKIRNEDIIQFVAYEGVLNDFRPVLVRMNSILDGLLKGKLITLYEKDKDLVEDIILSNRQLVELADDSQRTIVNIREAYTTIMTNNLNRVIKLFTTLTVLLTVPSVTMGVYSMNLPLPFEKNILTFWVVIIATIIICVSMLLIFIREDFL